jgi:exodeoxyribonuclease I
MNVKRHGLTEIEFANKIKSYFLKKRNNLILGYDSKKFDDSFTANLFYRNFIDPYSWFYLNDNKKADVYDMLMTGIAFRLDTGVIIPEEEGKITLKLEKIAERKGVKEIRLGM